MECEKRDGGSEPFTPGSNPLLYPTRVVTCEGSKRPALPRVEFTGSSSPVSVDRSDCSRSNDWSATDIGSPLGHMQPATTYGKKQLPSPRLDLKLGMSPSEETMQLTGNRCGLTPSPEILIRSQRTYTFGKWY